MQHSRGADGLVSSTVSQVHAGCKHQSSVAAGDETAGAGAKQPPTPGAAGCLLVRPGPDPQQAAL